MSTAAAAASSSSNSAAYSSGDTTEGSVKLLTLQSEDGEVFEVKETMATQSVTIKGIVDDVCASSRIPICNVTGRTLAMVIEWWNKHDIGAVSDEKELKEWESQFVTIDDKSGRDNVYDLLMAANYLNIPTLLDRCAIAVAEAIKGKTTEEIRELFDIKSDFDEKEEEDLRKENQWAFEN
ncbi:hypothetical protein LWI28_017688 [Acer negundo]|uniref:SKP1-like protein n=1 Tax=Acer negundo TaxID=4023 RepID=A0AAD5IFV9_ACENE|nr:hypothetical protein LWI28_017688 [Acer negundo]KAK4836902.1 hypothetical protein QYF36_001195 [Acer negundo]